MCHLSMHRILWKSLEWFLHNPVNKQTNKQTKWKRNLLPMPLRLQSTVTWLRSFAGRSTRVLTPATTTWILETESEEKYWYQNGSFRFVFASKSVRSNDLPEANGPAGLPIPAAAPEAVQSSRARAGCSGCIDLS